MNVYLEIFGYIGTLLILISMMMSSVRKLRIINICGSCLLYTSLAIYFIQLIASKFNDDIETPEWNVSIVCLVVAALFIVYFFVPTVF